MIENIYFNISKTCRSLYIYIHTYIHTHTHTHIHTYTHTHIHTHTHTQTSLNRNQPIVVLALLVSTAEVVFPVLIFVTSSTAVASSTRRAAVLV